MSLDERKGRILQAIVHDYVETIDPIGSEWLVSHYDFGCKSATIRNEMAEMSDRGYLRQPHTSAGRIPSDLGYRYYVDRLMPDAPLPSVARRPSESSGSTVDDLIQQTCRILSGMTQLASVATPPSTRAAALHRIFLSPASRSHILLVLLLSTGAVVHRVVEMDGEVDERALEYAGNYINRLLSGTGLGDLTIHTLGLIPTGLASCSRIIERVHAAITDAARSMTDERVFVEGTSQLLRQPEFRDIARLEQLLSALEQGSALYQLFSRAFEEDAVTVIIGEEAPVEAMRECSVVTSRYRIGDRAGGFIGIVGPTRMHYERAVGAVGLMARSLSDILTKHSIA